MKLFFDLFNKARAPQFAIKREMRRDGTEKLSPVVKLRIGGFVEDWTPIVRVEDKFQALHFERELSFTEEECQAYITGYRQQWEADRGHYIQKVVFQEV